VSHEKRDRRIELRVGETVDRAIEQEADRLGLSKPSFVALLVRKYLGLPTLT
jgi:predicted DNA binding CopG/RHH family protein